jgi:hypothetical protein
LCSIRSDIWAFLLRQASFWAERQWIRVLSLPPPCGRWLKRSVWMLRARITRSRIADEGSPELHLGELGEGHSLDFAMNVDTCGSFIPQEFLTNTAS